MDPLQDAERERLRCMFPSQAPGCSQTKLCTLRLLPDIKQLSFELQDSILRTGVVSRELTELLLAAIPKPEGELRRGKLRLRLQMRHPFQRAESLLRRFQLRPLGMRLPQP